MFRRKAKTIFDLIALSDSERLSIANWTERAVRANVRGMEYYVNLFAIRAARVAISAIERAGIEYDSQGKRLIKPKRKPRVFTRADIARKRQGKLTL